MKILKLFLLLVGCLLSISPVQAKSTQTWEDAKIQLAHKLELERDSASRCQLIWDTYWPWAKKGNQEARGRLLMDLYINGRTMPGSQDISSFLRHAFILAVYSAGFRGDSVFNETVDQFYDMRDVQKFYKGEFFTCVKSDRSEKCTAIAVKDHLVPSFDEYSAEIDLLINAGKESKCTKF